MTKVLLISAAAFALFASPALAQKAQTTGQSGQQTFHRLFVGQGLIDGNNVYDCTGKYLGTDPDPNIRAQILREGDPNCKTGQ